MRGFPVLVTVGFTVTLADADFVESAWLVAVTVAVVVELTVGAVNNPALEMVPAEAFQVTPVFVEPLTLAENCCVFPDESVALVGLIETETPVDAADTLIVTEELALLLALSFTVTVAVKVPAPLYEYEGFWLVEVPPSPKLQL